MGLEKLSRAQRILIGKLISTKGNITLGLHKIEDPMGNKVHMNTFNALLRKRYLVGMFDENYIPTWYINPHIPKEVYNELVAAIALGVNN